MPEDPPDSADRLTVRRHPLLAVFAVATLGDARNDDAVTDFDTGALRSHLGDDADALVPEHTPIGHRRYVAGENV
ncbi:Uncharacterised protein [Mycobacteroides abscessus subsp. abscessus]|nr:Uncharacterised protein [Mycobacteroides abscessus subsp. abscessus]